MRLSPLPFALAGLLGSTAALAPAPALAYPDHDRRYSYGGHGYYFSPYDSGSYGYPVAAEPMPYDAPAPVRSCNRGTVLAGAAIGGGLGALLANNSRNRRWSLPMGAAMGGILGGIVSGC